ncbi:uncharacterized protein MONBRDRAFT_12844 [Monosiga brevicollis MX1]|uniref:Major facilitator superfamily (MFS) profile domain-containing protein n=1 Tax=Monosiga brevicollis TaxID=81824 RepID=A9VDH6_MONBE|nr:uncharacterized protein MONBRDRAFT_12844 [Monosiga brevicollis MX1]EDQ84394.1 predicted protein [Monosiga brevicollis MX1]|eukprot:XP_001750795.1 hypothetical protein [Monosiga brevicollis MX1]
MEPDAVLERVGSGRFQQRLLVLTGLTLFSDGVELMVMPLLQHALEFDETFGAGAAYQTAVTVAVFAGMLLGALAVGLLADRYGRRAATLAYTATIAGFGLASALAPTPAILILARAGVGFGVAGTPAALTLYAEWLPAADRGRRLVSFMYFFSLGALFVTLLAWAVRERWRALLLLAALVPAMTYGLCWFYLPESLRFLVQTGQTSRARQLSCRAARINAIPEADQQDLQTAQLVTARAENHAKRQATRDASNSSGASAVESLAHAPAVVSRSLTSWWHDFWADWPLFSLLATEFLLMATVYYFLVLLTTVVQPETRRAAKFSDATYFNVAMANLAELPGLYAASWLLDLVGRRATIFLFFAVTGWCLLILSYGLDAKADCQAAGCRWLAATLWMARAAALGFNQSLWIFTTEAFATKHRALGLGLASSAARVGGALSPFLIDAYFRRSVAGRGLAATCRLTS